MQSLFVRSSKCRYDGSTGPCTLCSYKKTNDSAKQTNIITREHIVNTNKPNGADTIRKLYLVSE